MVLTTICTTLIWLSLYYFVFEMLLIKNLIEETDAEKFYAKKHRLWLLKWITFVLFLTYVIMVSLDYFNIVDNQHDHTDVGT